MNSDRISYGKLIYNRSNEVQVFQGTFTNPGEGPVDVAIKVLYFQDIEKANFIYKEVFSMMRFKDMPNVCKVYLCEISKNDQGSFFIRIAMQYYPNGDLKTLITNRRMHNSPFTTEELINHFRTSIKVFAEFQLKSVAHRDIKPENIFIADNGELVIGDLGCTDEIKLKSATIAGTPLYLSPEVREAYIECMRSGKVSRQYNVFKSDVYSLGLTFIFMATMEEFTEVATSPLSMIDSLVQAKLQQVKQNYPQIGFELEKMLKFNPEDRTTFIEIAIRNAIPLSISETFCKICERKFKCEYYSVGNRLICKSCFTSGQSLFETREDSL